LKTEEREPKASAGDVAVFMHRYIERQLAIQQSQLDHRKVPELWSTGEHESFPVGSSIFGRTSVRPEVSMESLILAQDERWRRA
jgi:hypothetical protein